MYSQGLRDIMKLDEPQKAPTPTAPVNLQVAQMGDNLRKTLGIAEPKTTLPSKFHKDDAPFVKDFIDNTPKTTPVSAEPLYKDTVDQKPQEQRLKEEGERRKATQPQRRTTDQKPISPETDTKEERIRLQKEQFLKENQ